MPLIIMSGLPLSGKTTVTEKLKNWFEINLNSKVIIISDEIKFNESKRNVLYTNSTLERQLRSWLRSEAERHLRSDNLIVLDASNYIKGFRYELYCSSKERKTTHCVIQLEITPEIAWNRNQSTDIGKDCYDRQTFEALVQRYETPDPSNRWDSPLFVIDGVKQEIPFDEIMGSLYQRKAPKPNLSTQSPALSSTNFLYELDSKTQQVVRHVLNCTQSGQLKNIVIPDSKQTVSLNRSVSIAELNKFRRLFINYTKTHPISDNQMISTLFVQFINQSV